MKRALIIIGVIVGLVYAVLLIAPVFIKNQFNEHAQEYIGRKAHLNELAFNPFTGKLTAGDLTVFERDNTTAFAGFKGFYVNINFLKLVIGDFQAEEVMIDSIFVHVINDNGTFNFDDLIAKSEPDTTAADNKEQSDIAFEILNFSMKNGLINYHEKALDHDIVIDSLTFALPRFAYDSHSANMDIEFIIDKTGLLAMSSNFYPDQSRLDCNLKLKNLGLGVAQPYTTDFMKIKTLDGKANCDLQISATFKDTTDFSLKGDVWLTHLQLTDSARQPLFAADSIGLSLKDIDYVKNSYQFGKLVLQNFALRVDIMDSTNNLTAAFIPESSAPDSSSVIVAEDSVSTSSPIFYSIDTILITGGGLKYRDYALSNYFEYNITDIVALANNVRADSSQARLSSSGILNGEGKYNANLVFNPTHPLDLEIDFTVDGFQMEDISPFTLTYAGHPIFEGNLIYEGHTTILSGIMNSENALTIYNLTVGDKAAENVLYAMPMKFAVFLLKDKDGIVNLELPMEGNMNDPSFKVGPLIWQIIKQNLAKIVAAPGKFLAKQFGMDEKDIRYIAFTPLDSTISEKNSATLVKLKELTEKKPGLLIELAYYEPSNLEAQTLALYKAKSQYVKEKLNPRDSEQTIKLIEKTDDNDLHFSSYLNTLFEVEEKPTDSLAVALYGMEQLLAETSSLKQSRQNAINYYLSDSTATAAPIRFIELQEVPKFPLEESGFTVGFTME